ncbi:DUF1576 domain-containing protein [Hathewaya histolytica]|uniref:Protein of uncharacterized function (DUF1576) n=1 Tax=Hathewaya histolytica TaxID=1498 RepID=A0A4U9QTA1_HATHI|nr:DUF1576 domain-containing protein [Hathewaya histolytica]VTQ81735.1 Protein of uncharacterised function (DUF1576) [Hathewaya histolytica]
MAHNIKRKIYKTYYVMIGYFLIFASVGLIMDKPKKVFLGLKNILFQSNILITDYVALGGIGAALFNASILSIIFLFLFIYVGIKPNGSTISCLWLMFGFGLFGKNLLNVWPIVFGVWLYSKYQKEPFLNYILIASFGTTLAPTLNELIFTNIFPLYISIPFALFISTTIGFILSPVTSYCIRIHQGYNLYNTGLSAGLIGTVLMSIFRAFGINFETRLIWAKGHNLFFGTLLICIFISFIILGYIFDKETFKKLKKIFKQPGRLVSDFYIMYGSGATFVNMGILGMTFTILVILIGGDLNGPTMGGIFTVVGFGAFGKHLRNVIPVTVGAMLSSFLNIWAINSPSMLLAILFSTTLAPISGHFGWIFGIIAGFTHVCMVMNLGYLHGGINLYNNGFAGGIVAMILVPIITSFKDKVVSSVD